MNSPRFVCPNDPALLRSFAGQTVAVRVDDIGLAAAAAAAVRESANELFCVIVETDEPLSRILFREDGAAIPLAIMTPSVGTFRDLAGNLGLLRRSNLRVYLPCNNPSNLSGLRMLSSLGIHCCADFAAGPTDWEALTDLMTYAVLGRVPHASIEPFSFIAANFDPHAILRWGAFAFDDPNHFLHLDSQGRIALSREELREGTFVAHSPHAIGSDIVAAAIRDRSESWRRFFVDNHPCASCAAWKVCLGKFADGLDEARGCANLFSELIELAGTLRSGNAQQDGTGIWRP